MSTAVATTAASAAVILALIGCVTALCIIGKIDGQATVGFLSGLGFSAAAVGAHAQGVRSGARAARTDT